MAGAHHRRPSSRLPDLGERDKMLRGEYFLPYTAALTADREACAASVWRFNNSTNPSLMLGPEQRTKYLRDIVGLRPTPEPIPAQAPPQGDAPPPPLGLPVLPSGSLGPAAVVEAPFHCEYGYNLTIGADVVIGPDCRVTDTASVVIGNGVIISPGVRMNCTTYAIDPRERRKGKGRGLARSIVIEDEAWIGTGVTILPGVTVGRCSTVGAGTVLHKVCSVPSKRLATKCDLLTMVVNAGRAAIHGRRRPPAEGRQGHLRRRARQSG